MSYSINDCHVVELPKIHYPQGNITPITGSIQIPFDIKRIYYLYDVPGGETRGGHAHYNLQQLIVAVSGSFDIIIDDGKRKKIITLNRPNSGLYLTPGIWRDLINFSSGAVLLVLASDKYDENDYIRDYNQFLINS
jgi:dTDP-4-dehydrorhamnose 3,5-epimerase-like enzyme